MRARTLAGVATFVVATALSPTAASAQIGPCPTLMPPPCIILDAGRIAGTIAEIKAKKQELEGAVDQAKEMKNVEGLLGKLGGATDSPITAFVGPIRNDLEPISISEASGTLDASLRQYGTSIDDKAAANRDDRLRIRAAAGEGFATAQAAKAKIEEFNIAYLDLFNRLGYTVAPAAGGSSQISKMKSSMAPSQFKAWCIKYVKNGSITSGDKKPTEETMQEDWRLNTSAKLLLLNAYTLRRDVETSRLQLAAIKSISARTGGGGATVKRVEAAPVEVKPESQYNIDLAKLMNVVTKLAALKMASDVTKSIVDGISGERQTQAEYRQMVVARDAAEQQVKNLAILESRRKGVSAARLLQVANQTMQQMDSTTWDDPSKRDKAKRAADFTKKRLDSMVNGDVSDQWEKLLRNRAEAFKQEAFFRDINADAVAFEKDSIASLTNYEKSLGVRASDPGALQAQIAQTEAEFKDLFNRLSSAPADIISYRDRIVESSGVKTAGSAAPAADMAGTPNWAGKYGDIGGVDHKPVLPRWKSEPPRRPLKPDM